MTAWRYQLYPVSPGREASQVQEALNNLGQQGWELVAVTDDGTNGKIYILKQPAE